MTDARIIHIFSRVFDVTSHVVPSVVGWAVAESRGFDSRLGNLYFSGRTMTLGSA